MYVQSYNHVWALVYEKEIEREDRQIERQIDSREGGGDIEF